MKKILVLLFLVLLSHSCIIHAQDTSRFNQINAFPTDIDFFTTDNQSNIYTVKADILTKYDKTGKLLYKYSNKNFGNITFVDASNMLKILVFYKHYLQVVFLDNTLSANGDPIGLDNLNFIQAQLVCSSHNNGMWIYDQQNLELVRIDQNLEHTQQTGNLAALLGLEMHPDYLIEYNNKVYLNNPGTGILVFDIYGTYYKTIPVKHARQFQPFGNLVYYNTGDEIRAYDLQTADELSFAIPLKEFKNFRLEMGILALQTNDSIHVYAPVK